MSTGIDATLRQHQDFLEALGKPPEIAEDLGKLCRTTFSAQHITVMKQRKIPWRWRPALAALAEQKGIAVPKGFLGYDPRKL